MRTHILRQITIYGSKVTWCGRFLDEEKRNQMPITEDHTKVTCVNCRKAVENAQRAGFIFKNQAAM